MTGTVKRFRARLDRLPPAWLFVLAGFLLQVALGVGLLVQAARGDDRVGLLVAASLLAVVLLAGVAALPVVVLLYLDRAPRAAAVLAVLVGAGTLAVNEFHPTVWLFPLALFGAAVRAWAGTLDALELLELDPARFERVDPDRSAEAEETDGDQTDDDSDGGRAGGE